MPSSVAREWHQVNIRFEQNAVSEPADKQELPIEPPLRLATGTLFVAVDLRLSGPRACGFKCEQRAVGEAVLAGANARTSAFDTKAMLRHDGVMMLTEHLLERLKLRSKRLGSLVLDRRERLCGVANVLRGLSHFVQRGGASRAINCICSLDEADRPLSAHSDTVSKPTSVSWQPRRWRWHQLHEFFEQASIEL